VNPLVAASEAVEPSRAPEGVAGCLAGRPSKAVRSGHLGRTVQPVDYRIPNPDYRFSSEKQGFSRKRLAKAAEEDKIPPNPGKYRLFGGWPKCLDKLGVTGSSPVSPI